MVSVLEMGRDCCFSEVLCGLGVGEGTRLLFSGVLSGVGAWDGTRLLFFRDFVWSRCLGWDETAVFPGFCAVSVLEMGRDCCFSVILCGLGA